MRMLAALTLVLAAAACATTTRAPLTDVPDGTYVLVDPAPDGYHAVALNDWAFTARVDDDVHTGQHWLDDQGRLHMADDEGPCAGVESIWTYDYTGDRVELTLVEDRCDVRPMAFPDRMIYERR